MSQPNWIISSNIGDEYTISLENVEIDEENSDGTEFVHCPEIQDNELLDRYLIPDYFELLQNDDLNTHRLKAKCLKCDGIYCAAKHSLTNLSTHMKVILVDLFSFLLHHQ